MKTLITASILALSLLSGPASADPKTIWTTISESAPRSIFDQIRDSAPLAPVFETLRNDAP